MPFKKGQSGNPKGRPTRPVEDVRHSLLLKTFRASTETEVIKAVIATAKDGNLQAATWLWERKYGKPSDQPLQSVPTTIRVEYGDHRQPAVPQVMPLPWTPDDQ